MKRLSPTRRLYIKVIELKEQMERLVAHDGTPEAIVKLSRVERRYWPLQGELLRRMDHYDWYEARQRFFDNADPLGYKNGENNAAMQAARLEMNAAYMRFAAHPCEQAKAAAWRKENGI